MFDKLLVGLIETDYRLFRIFGGRIKIKHIFKTPDKFGIHFRDTP